MTKAEHFQLFREGSQKATLSGLKLLLLLLLFLLFWHSAMSLNAQEERLATSP